MPLDEALETLKNNIDAAKGKEQVRVFFLGANSDAFDMRLMQYTLARHSTNAKRGGDEVWFDMLTDIGVVGTIDTIRVLPSFEIIDGLNGKNGRSVGKMHQMILGQPLTGAHRAGTDVDGVINILCDKRITKKMMKDATAIPLSSWFEHSNHSKARLAWEKNMEAEIEAENATPSQVGSVVVASGECGNSDDDVSESSEDYIAEEIVGHVGGNKSRKYIVRWQGYAADDTSEEPARKFGTLLPIELLVNYLSKHPSAKQGHPGNKSTLKSLNS